MSCENWRKWVFQFKLLIDEYKHAGTMPIYHQILKTNMIYNHTLKTNMIYNQILQT